MNRIVLLFVCVITASTVIATENPPKRKKFETAPLVTTPKTIVKHWEPTAFVQEGERLPVNYSGLDPKKFLAMFKSKAQGLQKGEFETTEEFTQRRANMDALLAPINTSDLYAFRIDRDIKYDADTEAYTIIDGRFGYSCNEARMNKNWFTCKVASVSRVNDTYRASNAFGVSRTVDRTRVRDFALAIAKDSPLLSDVFSLEPDNYGRKILKYKINLSVPLEKARGLKDMKVAVLFVGRVNDATIVEGRAILLEPAIDNPIDIFITEEAVPFALKKVVYYVIQTGEVLAQKDF